MLTNRATAEAARSRVIAIEALAVTTPELESERAECVRVWNEFCTQESAALARTRASKCDPRVAVYETYRKLGWL